MPRDAEYHWLRQTAGNITDIAADADGLDSGDCTTLIRAALIIGYLAEARLVAPPDPPTAA